MILVNKIIFDFVKIKNVCTVKNAITKSSRDIILEKRFTKVMKSYDIYYKEHL